MKSKLIILLMLSVCACCAPVERNEEPQSEKLKPTIPYNDTPHGITVITIEGCQYVYAETGSGVAICHKANCINPIH